MRKGQNPAKFVGQVARPERITAAVLSPTCRPCMATMPRAFKSSRPA